MSLQQILNKPTANIRSWSNLTVNSITSASGINATELQGVPVSTTTPTDTQVLTYSSGSGQWVPAASGGGGGGIPYSSGSIDLYIDAVSGNDANSGLVGFPVQTWNRLLEVGSGYNTDVIIIHLVAGQTLDALTSTLDTPIEEYDIEDLYVITDVLDFSPLGARSIKVITDLVSPTILTPSAAAGWSTTTGGPGFIYFDHSSLSGLVGADRWLYNAATGKYYSSDWSQNSNTRTYCIDWDGTLASYTFYDRTQIATIELTGETLINAPNKSVVFEQLSFIADNSIKLNGNITFKGCNSNVLSVAFLSGFEILFESCRVGVIINYDGVCNCNFCYTDDTIDYERNSSGALSYCYIDTFDAFNNANIRAYNTEFIGGNIEVSNNSRLVFDSCGATNMTLYGHDNGFIDIEAGVWQATQFNMVKNANLVINSLAASCAVSVIAQQGSRILINSCALTSNLGTSALLSADEDSYIRVQSGSIADTIAGAPSATPFIVATDMSIIDIKTAPVNTTSNRSAAIIYADKNSKIWLPQFTVSSALTSTNLIRVWNNSEIYFGGTMTMNTSQNMIFVDSGSKLSAYLAAVNSGAGTVLKRGSSAAGAFAFDSTFSTTVANNITIIQQLV